VRDVDVFQQALGLESPWRVERVEFDAEAKRLDLYLDFERGSRFECPECGARGCPAYDTTQKSWRHLDFFQHQAMLHAWVPRVECETCGVKQAEVPWARKGSGFTLLFEAFVMAIAPHATVAAAARLLGETDHRLWRIIHHYVDQARDEADYSEVRRVGVDETSSKRGQNYVSFFVDLDERRLLFGTEGREADALGRFRLDLWLHGGHPDEIEELCMDLSPAYLLGARRHFPNAFVTLDRFHVMRLFNQAIDEVRRQEQKERPELKRTRWLWLKGPSKLTAWQIADLEELLDPDLIALSTAKAYQMKLAFQEFWELPPSLATRFLTRWCRRARATALAPLVRLAATLERHREALLNWYYSRVSNGLLEAMNSLVQAAKARARGYRTTENLITMAYLIAGNLEFNLPT
jgi:transposase